jgi:hypothetical protein
MKRLFIICLLMCNLCTTRIYAFGEAPLKIEVPPFEFPPFEEAYYNIGYKSVWEALKECELHFQRELRLPIKLPPVEFSHHFGRFNKDSNNFNDKFEIEYLNEKQAMNHYNIDVVPVEQRINYEHSKNFTMKTYRLKDGTSALYFTETQTRTPLRRFNILVFEKNDWQYRISVDYRLGDKVPANALLEIAESTK